ncbi:hypothetical protein AB0469_32820 [Streptomyces sp. NPDC093801]|uniref:hypothetical protein n=1 Tax=Streptomyces sp. NPDC093801 TaxID=3155203 RepID=UPI00344E6AEB
MPSSFPRDVLSVDTPGSPGTGTAPLPPPGADLLDRALVGWERFLLGVFAEASDE